MQFILLVGLSLAMIIHTVLTCPPEAETLDYQRELCDAIFVVRGVSNSAMSSVATTEDGRQMVGSRYFVNTQEYFRDTTGERADSVSVSRIYYQDEPCSTPLFSEPSESDLIFATNADIPRCDFSIPWDCVPESAKTILRENNC